MKDLHPTLRNLVTNERGNVLMTFGLSCFVVLGCVGAAVDFGRAYSQKSRMQNALDAAVVSGVAKYRESNDWASAKTHALNVFKATYTSALSPTTAIPNPVGAADQAVVNFTQSGTQLAGTASMKVSAPFVALTTGFWSGNDMAINIAVNSNAIPPSGKMLEVALMVDVTGSMGWDASAGSNPTNCSIVTNPTKKIDYLKCAAEDLLNILLPTNGANNSAVRIGVAPFADKVNAGIYAADATGLAATGGQFATLTNLASTKSGPWTGMYSGANTTAASQPTGAQYAAMGSVAVSGATNTAAGATYANAHCAVTTNPATAAVMGTINATSLSIRNNDSYDYYRGIKVTVTGTKPTSVLEGNDINPVYGGSSAANARQGKHLSSLQWDGDDDEWYWSYGEDLKEGEFYVPLVTNKGTLTAKTKDKDGVAKPVGVYLPRESGTWNYTRPTGVSRNDSGYWKVSNWSGTDWTYTWVPAGGASGGSYDFFIPLYDGLESGYTPAAPATTKPECVAAAVAQPVSHLITCVTERKNGNNLDYTADAVSSGRYVGPYNHGSTSKSNYSSDGKCWSAGRELPSVVALTNDRTSLWNLFDTAKVGGATAGHLGTAWASYLLSPDMNDSVFKLSTAPAAYTNTGVMKAAILMTDGEYNIQFSTGGLSTNTSAKQALMLCSEMRAKGIKVFTVGFGFAENATPPTPVAGMSETDRTTPASTGTTQQRALDTLAKCASDANSYYFPYDGESLRTVFKNIANSLSSDIAGGTARITN